MTTTIKTFSKMLYAFVLFAGLIMTSCETADPVDDSKDPENSENTETPDNIIVFADEVVKSANALGEKAYIIGCVTDSEGVEL